MSRELMPVLTFRRKDLRPARGLVDAGVFWLAQLGGVTMKFVNSEGLFYATQHSAAFDIKAAVDITVPAHGRVLVDSGLQLDVPMSVAKNECLLILSRSGMALKQGVFVLNAPGLVDADYAGPIGVILANMSGNDVQIKTGDRIAQGMVVANQGMSGIFVQDRVRGEGGFGSTGK